MRNNNSDSGNAISRCNDSVTYPRKVGKRGKIIRLDSLPCILLTYTHNNIYDIYGVIHHCSPESLGTRLEPRLNGLQSPLLVDFGTIK